MTNVENEDVGFIPGPQLQLGCCYRFPEFCKILNDNQFASAFTIEVIEDDENLINPSGKIVKYIRVIGIHL